MRKVIADQWYVVDKAGRNDCKLLAVSRRQVETAARKYYEQLHAIKVGRFSTPFAIYSLGALLTDDEKS